MQASRLLSQYNCNFAFPLNVSYYNHAITQPARLRGETQQPQRATCHIWFFAPLLLAAHARGGCGSTLRITWWNIRATRRFVGQRGDHQRGGRGTPLRQCAISPHGGVPRVIIEYKAPHIAITQHVFQQIYAYNSVLRADYLIVSNGIKHYCCHVNYQSMKVEYLQDIPNYTDLAWSPSG